MLSQLNIWYDPVPRAGPENMAVDEWLLEGEGAPLLRIYDWEGPWGSLGYFGKIKDARGALPNPVKLVRRATGGGIVDHRHDRTYTLVIPRGWDLAQMRGTESYRVIHAELCEALRASGIDARLIEKDANSNSMVCFDHPVAWDIIGTEGRKLAGAGQRRTRMGLLHQGSVLAGQVPDELFLHLARGLATRVEKVRREPPSGELAARERRYESRSWLERR